MLRFRALLAFAVVLLLEGCKIEISVPRGGVVESTSGEYSCASGETCIVEVTDIFFDQEFVAVPEEGFVFLSWVKRRRDLCGGRSTSCRLATASFEGNDALLAVLASNERFFLEPLFGRSDTYAVGAAMPIGGASRAACSVDGKLYVFGAGWETVAALNTTQEYDPASDSWRRRANMPTARAWATASAYRGECYVIGGSAGGESEAVVEVYDPRADSWRERAPLPDGRFSASSVTVGNRIYVVGGSGGRLGTYAEVSSALFMYDPDRDRWSSGANLPTPRRRMGIGAVDGMIYTVGGGNPLQQIRESDVVERYDPATDRWVRRAPLPADRSSVAAASVGGHLYVFGGFGENPIARSTAYRYDPTVDRWQQIASLNTARGDAVAGPSNGQIVIAGGRAPDHNGEPISETEIYTP